MAQLPLELHKNGLQGFVAEEENGRENKKGIGG